MMTLIFFKDLLETKNISLIMAEVDDKICSLDDSKFLYNQLKSYYLESNDNDEKFKLLESFAKHSDQFKHMDLIKQLEKDGLAKVPISLKDEEK
jgi:hypothetical protein